MKLTLLKIRPKTEKIYKCYRCGYISNNVMKHCPTCTKDGFYIRMIVLMGN